MTRNSYVSWIEKYYVFVGIILFFVSYLAFYPELWMITDAYSYSSQALAFAEGNPYLTQYNFLSQSHQRILHPPYNLGTSAYYAFWIKLFTAKGIFLGSIFAAIFSSILLHATLKRLKYNQLGTIILFISPVLFFSRSIMSGMPSLLLMSAVIYLLGLRPKSINAFLLSFLCFLSVWFRETNIILAGAILFYYIWKNLGLWKAMLSGALIALSIKLLSTFWVYGHFWFQSHSEGFSFANLSVHMSLYLIISLILIPGGYLFLLLYRGKACKSITVSSSLFIAVYIFYNYSAIDFSGWLKGSLLTSRFVLPLIPFVVLALGEVIDRKPFLHSLIFFILVPFSLVLIPISQKVFYDLYAPHENAAKYIANKYADQQVLYDQSGFTNIIRYINPLSASWTKIADIKEIGDNINRERILNDSESVYVIISESNTSQEKFERASSVQQYLDLLPFTAFDSVRIDETNQLKIYKLQSD